MRKSYSEKTFSQKGSKGKEEHKDSVTMKMSRSISEKAMVTMKKMKDDAKSNKFLISINVLGSAGAIRFVVKGDDSATAVIQTALKIYARQGRLPILGSDADAFFLYPANAGFQALNPSDNIGSRGARSFVLSKKLESEMINGKGRGWRAWLQNSLRIYLLNSNPTI